MHNKKILIIEDEGAIADLISYALNKEGFMTRICATGAEGLEEIKCFCPDMIILDLMLPGMSGYDICKAITKNSTIPIVMLTAKSDIVDKILGMELGADDYITKPFEIREVIARIKAIFRRIDLTFEAIEEKESTGIRLGNGIEILKESHEVLKGKKRVELTNKEYELLVFLAENKGRVFTRGDLLDRVWGFEFVGDTRTVDIHIQRLRKKLDDSKHTPMIETVFGVGYKIT